MPSTLRKDIPIGTKFGKWIVVADAGARLHTKSKPAQWLCKCECGNELIIPGVNLRVGLTTQCRSCSQKARTDALVKNNMKRSGTNHHGWKGGRTSTGRGYIRLAKSVVREIYPDAVMDHRHARGMMEHHAVMSNHLKRVIFLNETVHHKDGNRQNNDLSNLELRMGNHGPGQDIPDIVAWAEEILHRYAPDKLR